MAMLGCTYVILVIIRISCGSLLVWSKESKAGMLASRVRASLMPTLEADKPGPNDSKGENSKTFLPNDVTVNFFLVQTL